MRKHLAVVAALTLAIGTAACGDDDEGGDGGEDDFITQLNTVCEESTQDVITANLELGYSTDPKEQAELAERTQKIRVDSTAEIEKLEPPEEDADTFDRFLAAREDLIAAGEDRLAAVESQDEAASAEAAEAQAKAGDKEDEVASELGADHCDGDLPDEEAQAAEDVLREYATTADPATSCSSKGEGLVTEPYLEEGFGGVEACEKEQKRIEDDPKLLPEDIEVSSVTGVEGQAATLEYEDVGGEFDALPSEATLYYIDGGWKLFSIRPLE
ncbi:MAG: hypothetical protein M3Y34_06645 [Actinomycetota bacterium]|nr:hypothetical protein [Actinomycetota bacterium]